MAVRWTARAADRAARRQLSFARYEQKTEGENISQFVFLFFFSPSVFAYGESTSLIRGRLWEA